jgi:hypothetical protein
MTTGGPARVTKDDSVQAPIGCATEDWGSNGAGDRTGEAGWAGKGNWNGGTFLPTSMNKRRLVRTLKATSKEPAPT